MPNQHRIRIASPESGFFTILSQRVFLLNFQGDFWSTTCAGGRAYASESFPNSKSILGRSPNNLLDFGDRLKMPDDKPNSSMKVEKYNQFNSKMTKSWRKSWKLGACSAKNNSSLFGNRWDVFRVAISLLWTIMVHFGLKWEFSSKIALILSRFGSHRNVLYERIEFHVDAMDHQ